MSGATVNREGLDAYKLGRSSYSLLQRRRSGFGAVRPVPRLMQAIWPPWVEVEVGRLQSRIGGVRVGSVPHRQARKLLWNSLNSIEPDGTKLGTSVERSDEP